MKKTSIYIEPELDRAVANWAAREGISKAEFVRRSLRRATNGAKHRPRPSVGVFEGPGDLSTNPDHMRGFGSWSS